MFLGSEIIEKEYKEFESNRNFLVRRLKQEIVDLDDYSEESFAIWPLEFRPEKIRFEYTPLSPSIWEGIKSVFEISFSVEYPFKPPRLSCLSKTIHPNISEDGKVCLSIVKEDWSPSYTMRHILLGVSSLFYHPQLDDPLNSRAASLMLNDIENFKKLIKLAD